MDLHEHQSWTAPGHQLLNLYQRQCLTIDRDAPAGRETEIYKVPLTDVNHPTGSVVAILVLNLASHRRALTVTWDQLGLIDGDRYHVRDLWMHEDSPIPMTGSVSLALMGHGVKMLKMTPVRD